MCKLLFSSPVCALQRYWTRCERVKRAQWSFFPAEATITHAGMDYCSHLSGHDYIVVRSLSDAALHIRERLLVDWTYIATELQSKELTRLQRSLPLLPAVRQARTALSGR